jgi:hypothetical protein
MAQTKALAEYIQCLVDSQQKTNRASDRSTYNLLLAGAATIFAKMELNSSFDDAIQAHERLLGNTWIEEKEASDAVYEKWSAFKKSV